MKTVVSEKHESLHTSMKLNWSMQLLKAFTIRSPVESMTTNFRWFFRTSLQITRTSTGGDLQHYYGKQTKNTNQTFILSLFEISRTNVILTKCNFTGIQS